ncbi:aminotransferase [Pseudomaricurvus alkylphenolicus]|uniref:aminotransferase n=1 Tax=Pseudomaricurvus alkylphenolicus TaxID=1306991 RepID=UPI0014206060|nr:aminotransferase [Pseudomaricurvus alkylphenolicus]NIB42188.1 aminotransferase [Pseudomaricurvus alkylphenolicus]
MTERDMAQFEQYNTSDLWQKDRDHHLHPWQHFDSFREAGATVMVQGDGCYVYDSDGGRYFDGIGGMWCVNIGYGREEMVEVIAEQTRRLPYFNPFVDTTNAPAAELASKLAQWAPGSLNHVFFSCGGSTANDTAFRLIQFYQSCRGKPQKQHIIAREDSYHGSTYVAMSIGGKAADHVPEFSYITDTIHHVSSPNSYRRPEGASESEFCDHLISELENKILSIGPEKVAAFFAEPIMGSGGVIVPPAGYHRRTWELCKQYDVLYVSDEVVTAFGRLGHMFASEEVFGIQPDIITCAKGLSSGYLPLGATIYSDEIHQVIDEAGENRSFAHGFTYSAHPVCCAAALKNMEILERDNILGQVQEVGPYFEQQLRSLMDLEIVGDVRGHQFMMCVENVANKETKALLSDEIDVGKRITQHCESMGLLVRPIGHLNVLSPPLTMTREQVDFVVEVLRSSIKKTMDDLVKEGLWKG